MHIIHCQTQKSHDMENVRNQNRITDKVTKYIYVIIPDQKHFGIPTNLLQ
jgi:hypothetical protein